MEMAAEIKSVFGVHNSLQHDTPISVSLLSILIEEVEKESESENKKEKKDPIPALAERIKQIYAEELVQESYSQAALSSYKAGNDRYHQVEAAVVQQSTKTRYEESENTFEKKKSDIHKRIKEESSKGYKLNRDSRYQANVMSDPRGRLVSTWTYVRSVNETPDGKISANDGYISQGF